MAISINSAAKYVCELGGWNVTNLQLQKIIYLAHMRYIGKNNGEPLVNTFFEAWDYGPVCPVLYHDIKHYGNKPIRTGFHSAVDISDTKEGQEIFDAANFLLTKSPSRLVGFTHRKGGAWEKNYCPGMYGVVIPNEDILAESKDIFGGR